jgi:hypothetical protein
MTARDRTGNLRGRVIVDARRSAGHCALGMTRYFKQLPLVRLARTMKELPEFSTPPMKRKEDAIRWTSAVAQEDNACAVLPRRGPGRVAGAGVIPWNRSR